MKIYSTIRNFIISPFMNQRNRYSSYLIGDWTYGAPNILDWGSGELTIGKFCSIASEVKILVGGEHHSDWISTYPFDAFFGKQGTVGPSHRSKGGVEIGNDVWIGTDVLILSGVKIGDGAIIGARSVVTKNVAPYSVVVGNPATLIRLRFSPEQIAALLRIRWWDWPIPELTRIQPMLMSKDLEAFIQTHDPLIKAT
ncbi:MAG: CatB-related O-acetyltransferase [Holophagaceae bacterium]|uniref:CatB-related O-acetyltransferase n=1 Tax=Candidatus Geothrix skivensis TaxID=2954439 RepID=A0A9D7SDN7_9BACT|nr:CatB-related O-acetyltransferase [Candidatus Geothrix skivensis]